MPKIPKHIQQEKYLKKFKEVHGDKYGYDRFEYITSKTKTQVWCKVHQEYFSISPNKHWIGRGCPKCGLDSVKKKLKGSIEEFREKANVVHNGRYTYPNQEYVNYKTHIVAVCNIHGEFKQTPVRHLKGLGCPSCLHEDMSWFRNRVYKTTKPAYVYLLESDSALKIGISTDYKRRINAIRKETTGMVWQLVHLWEGPAWECFNLERLTLYQSPLKRYREDEWEFSGKSECFKLEDYTDVVNHINSVADTLIGVCQTK